MKSDLLEKFLALKDIKANEILDEAGDFEDYEELTKLQKKQIKEAAELFKVIAEVLDRTDDFVTAEFGRYVGDTRYWSASSFRC